jgi:hypothetical protein
MLRLVRSIQMDPADKPQGDSVVAYFLCGSAPLRANLLICVRSLLCAASLVHADA